MKNSISYCSHPTGDCSLSHLPSSTHHYPLIHIFDSDSDSDLSQIPDHCRRTEWWNSPGLFSVCPKRLCDWSIGESRNTSANMPGILPMKMIRVGGNNQSRIAQACDRCRSKKIRCDGVRPCCSQCENVGFECKTSDKLSRRAFPRGYTESLEDRVRALEGEVRELKDLLDEKDEKIDLLSRLHSFSPVRKNSASLSPANSAQIKVEVASAQEELLHVEIPAPVDHSTAQAGTSTTNALIDAFESNVTDKGRTCPTISTPSLLTASSSQRQPLAQSNKVTPVPPRLLSDQYISKSMEFGREQ